MQIINGKAKAEQMNQEAKAEVEKLKTNGHRAPHLVVVLVGNDPASESYVKFKEKACALVGIESTVIKISEDVTEEKLLQIINALNHDFNVDGILVQLPLPKGIETRKILEAISIEKDVDGFHPLNVGNLRLNIDSTIPCTPKGIIKLLQEVDPVIAGKHAVVVGRSDIVGKPVASILLALDATVTQCHAKTVDLAKYTKQADILVTAVGRSNLITADMINSNCIVIDVGINKQESGKLVGDVDFEGCKEIARAITPVPGGVGPMTIACLLENTIELYKKKNKLS